MDRTLEQCRALIIERLASIDLELSPEDIDRAAALVAKSRGGVFYMDEALRRIPARMPALGDRVTVRKYGNTYRGHVTKVGRTYVDAAYRLASGEGRESRFRVTNSRELFKSMSPGALFVPEVQS